MYESILQISYTLEQLGEVAIQYWEMARAEYVQVFSGEMGAGKTTLIHRLCDYLGVEDTVSSPTFALINEYHFRDTDGADKIIYHLDWYRLRDSAEAIQAGMEDCLQQAWRGEAYCFIEWPEKAADLLQGHYLRTRIETTGIDSRKIVVENAGR